MQRACIQHGLVSGCGFIYKWALSLSMCRFSGGMGLRGEHCQAVVPHCDSGMVLVFFTQNRETSFGIVGIEKQF